MQNSNEKLDLKSSPNTTKYLLGDVVIATLWALLISGTWGLASITSYYLVPLWLYLVLCFIGFAIPKVKPGVYSLNSKEASLWFISFQFGRIWTYPPIKHFIFSFVTLRTFFLRCCGAKVSMGIGWSTISTLSDPSMLVAEDEVIIGVESLISGHLIVNNKLYLKPIILKRGSLIGARCAIAPDVVVGEGTTVQNSVTLLPGTRIPENCVIGYGSTINKNSKLEAGKTFRE